MMDRSIATVSLGGDLLEKLRAASAAGFDGVEMLDDDLAGSGLSASEARRICSDLGLEIFLFQPLRSQEGVHASQLEKNLELARRKFDIANQLGANRILVCSNVDHAMVRDDGVIAAQLRILAELASTFGIVLGFEALSWGVHVHSYRHAWRLVQAVDHPNLGIILDSFHTFAIGETVEDIERIPGARIVFVQVADARTSEHGDVRELSRHHRLLPGEGDYDLPRFVTSLCKAGYAGPLSLEIFNDEFHAMRPEPIALRAYRSLSALERPASNCLVA